MGTDRSECSEQRGGPKRSLHGPCWSRPVPNDGDHLSRSPVRRSRSLLRDRLTRTAGLVIPRIQFIIHCDAVNVVFTHRFLLFDEPVNRFEEVWFSAMPGGLEPRILRGERSVLA